MSFKKQPRGVANAFCVHASAFIRLFIKMVNYQFKIEYSPGKFVICFRNIDTSSYTFYNLVDDIKKRCPGFAHLTPQTIRIRFLDDDGDYINLTEDDPQNVDEMLQQAKFVEERNVRKIQLRVSELDSPCPVVNRSPADKKRKIDTEHGKGAVALKPRSLNFTSKTSQSDTRKSNACTSDDNSPLSALETYVYNAQKKVDVEKSKLEQMQLERHETLQRLEAAKVAAGDADAKTCGNCHLRLGHSQKKCTLEKCTDVFCCGQEKRHPGQFNKRRLDQEISRQEKVVLEAEEELKRRTSSVQIVQKSKTKQIENNLIDNHKADYTNERGNLDWNLIRKHTLLIENYCKKHMNGKIPGKQSLSNILRKATQDYKESNYGKAFGRSKKRKGNPAKKTLEEHGIDFPGAPQISSDSEDKDYYDRLPEVVSKQSTDLTSRAMPRNVEEEESQLELALQASLQTKNYVVDADSYPQRSAINPAAMPMAMPMFSYDYPRPNYNNCYSASLVPPYYNYNYSQHGQSGVYQFNAGASTITSSQAISVNDADEIDTAITCVSNDASPVFEDTTTTEAESVAMALLNLNRKE